MRNPNWQVQGSCMLAVLPQDACKNSFAVTALKVNLQPLQKAQTCAPPALWGHAGQQCPPRLATNGGLASWQDLHLLQMQCCHKQLYKVSS